MPLDQRQRSRYAPLVDRPNQRIGVLGGLLFIRNVTFDFHAACEHRSPSWLLKPLPRPTLDTVYGVCQWHGQTTVCVPRCRRSGRPRRSAPHPDAGRTERERRGGDLVRTLRRAVRPARGRGTSRPGLRRPPVWGCVARRVVVSRRRRATCSGARQALQATHVQLPAHAVHHPARSRAGVAGPDRPRAPSATYAPLSASPD